MKTIISIFFVLFSINANADVIASYDFGRSTDEFNGLYKSEVVHANLSEDGVLSVSIQQVGPKVHPLAIAEIVAVKKIHPDNFARLFNSISILSNVEISEENFLAVCAMYAPFYMSHDYLKVARGFSMDKTDKGFSFSGPLTTILGPQGCWVGYVIKPVSMQHENAANSLRDMIRVLTIELLD